MSRKGNQRGHSDCSTVNGKFRARDWRELPSVSSGSLLSAETLRSGCPRPGVRVFSANRRMELSADQADNKPEARGMFELQLEQ